MGQQQRSKRTTFQIQLTGFETKSVPLFPSGSLDIKSMFFELLGALPGGGTQWVLQQVVHACVTTKCRGMTKIIEKVGHHASNLCFVGERNSEHRFFELRTKLDYWTKRAGI